MSNFLAALKCQNSGAPPVWIMRQAGRYLPEYRTLRESYSLATLFHSPELIVQVTKQPLMRFDLDAAIVFSDILLLIEMFGKTIHFPEGIGPIVDPLLEKPEDIAKLKQVASLPFVYEAIRELKKELTVPLIGFCGGPFTVASYMIDQPGQLGLPRTKKWLYENPTAFHMLLQKLTEASIEHLRAQVDAGADAVQIFDSWAGVLAYEEFQTFALFYLKQIVDALEGTPVILFTRGSCLLASELASIYPAAISFDWQMHLEILRKTIPKSIAVQGNLDPQILLASKEIVEWKTFCLLKSMQGEKGFILNLGHGILPKTPLENVEAFVQTAKKFTPAFAG